jgi:hypothetical protein
MPPAFPVRLLRRWTVRRGRHGSPWTQKVAHMCYATPGGTGRADAALATVLVR